MGTISLILLLLLLIILLRLLFQCIECISYCGKSVESFSKYNILDTLLSYKIV